jgi:hypothetical protein
MQYEYIFVFLLLTVYYLPFPRFLFIYYDLVGNANLTRCSHVRIVFSNKFTLRRLGVLRKHNSIKDKLK